jgi:hypothetical protein
MREAMMTQNEALKLALDALEYPLNTSASMFDADMAELKAHRAMNALREWLDEPFVDYRAMYLKVRDELAALQEREPVPDTEELEQPEPVCVECGDKLMSDFTQVCYACVHKPEPEPVACIGTNGDLMWLKKPTVVYSKPQPLYTTPPKREPEPEPVAWMTINEYGEEDDIHYENPEGKLLDGWTYKPLYTHPPMSQQESLEYWNAVEGWVKIDEVRNHFDSVGCGTIYKTAGENRVPLYTTPPKREPLTYKQIQELFGEKYIAEFFIEFVRAIEAAHGIGEMK